MATLIRNTKNHWGLRHKKGDAKYFNGVYYDIATETIPSNFNKLNVPWKAIGLENKKIVGVKGLKHPGSLAADQAFNQYSLAVTRDRFKGQPKKYRRQFIERIHNFENKGGEQEAKKAASKIKKEESALSSSRYKRDMKGDIDKNPAGKEQKNVRIPISASQGYEYKEFYSTWGGKQGNTYSNIRKRYGSSSDKERKEVVKRE